MCSGHLTVTTLTFETASNSKPRAKHRCIAAAVPILNVTDHPSQLYENQNPDSWMLVRDKDLHPLDGHPLELPYLRANWEYGGVASASVKCVHPCQ